MGLLEGLTSKIGGGASVASRIIHKAFPGVSFDEISNGRFLIEESFLENEIEKQVAEYPEIQSISLSCFPDKILITAVVYKYLASIGVKFTIRALKIHFGRHDQGLVLSFDTESTMVKGGNLVGKIAISFAEALIVRVANDRVERSLSRGVRSDVEWPDVAIDLSETAWIKRVKKISLFNRTIFDLVNLQQDKITGEGIWLKITKAT